jgi:hypothetical protein
MMSIRVIGIDLQGELQLSFGSRPLVLLLINHSQVVMVCCVRGSRFQRFSQQISRVAEFVAVRKNEAEVCETL